LNQITWNKFVKTREYFRKLTDELSLSLPNLKNLQQELADTRAKSKNSSYVVQTPVVYNSALDDVTASDEIKLILAADNPGRREQAVENRRYLVGPSGKIAKKFFNDNPALGIDFDKNVIILNKTPIHSPRTAELRELCRMEAGNKKPSIFDSLEESQRKMAYLLYEFHLTFDCPVWIIGYGQMRKGGIFETYTEKLKELYIDKENEMYKKIFLYRHFSMNQFTIDLKQQMQPGENFKKALVRIGTSYRKRILGK
jgi:hypothetical protein